MAHAEQQARRRFRLPSIVWIILIAAALVALNQFSGPTFTRSLIHLSEQGGWPQGTAGHDKCWTPEGNLYNASPEEKWAKGCGSHP